MGTYAAPIPCCSRGLRTAQRSGYKPAIAGALFHLGQSATEQGAYPEAIRLLRRAHRLIGPLGGVEEGLLAVLECVRAYCRSDMTPRARRLFTAAEQTVRLRGVGPTQLAVLLTKAELELVQGNADAALCAAEEGRTLARTRGQRREEGRALILIGPRPTGRQADSISTRVVAVTATQWRFWMGWVV